VNAAGEFTSGQNGKGRKASNVQSGVGPMARVAWGNATFRGKRGTRKGERPKAKTKRGGIWEKNFG